MLDRGHFITGDLLISVGIDVSKGKSTVCILKPYGEVLMAPKDFKHTQSELKVLVEKMKKFEEETHVVILMFLFLYLRNR